MAPPGGLWSHLLSGHWEQILSWSSHVLGRSFSSLSSTHEVRSCTELQTEGDWWSFFVSILFLNNHTNSCQILNKLLVDIMQYYTGQQSFPWHPLTALCIAHGDGEAEMEVNQILKLILCVCVISIWNLAFSCHLTVLTPNSQSELPLARQGTN